MVTIHARASIEQTDLQAGAVSLHVDDRENATTLSVSYTAEGGVVSVGSGTMRPIDVQSMSLCENVCW
jgi:hypothetical protein